MQRWAMLVVVALLVTAAAAQKKRARVFTVDDVLNLNGEGVMVNTARIDLAGDVYMKTGAAATKKLQDLPADIQTVQDGVNAAATAAAGMQAFLDAHLARSASGDLTITPAATPAGDSVAVKADKDVSITAGKTITLTAPSMTLNGAVVVPDADGKMQSLNTLTAAVAGANQAVADAQAATTAWQAKYFTGDASGLTIMTGLAEDEADEARVRIEAAEIDLHGEVQVLDGDGRLVNINNLPAMVQKNGELIAAMGKTIAMLTEAIDELRSRCQNGEFELMPPTATSARVCRPVTACPDGEFESVAPTATTDRSCTAHAECAPGTFEVRHPTPVSDRVCQAWTTCAADEYEQLAPTPFQDRVCAKASKCGADTYTAQPATASSQAVCLPYTVCNQYQDEFVAPTPSSNRVCTVKVVECVEDEFEVSAPTSSRPRVCQAFTRCTATQYQTAAPTETSDRVCKDATTCGSDEYESVAPTTTSDRTCTALTQCKEGEEESVKPTATSDRQCFDPDATGCSQFSIHSKKINERLWFCSDGAEYNKGWDRVTKVCNLAAGWKLVSVRPMSIIGKPSPSEYDPVRDYYFNLGYDYVVTGHPARSCSWSSWETGFSCNGMGYLRLGAGGVNADSNWAALTDGNNAEQRGWPSANAASVPYHKMPSLCGYFADIKDGNGNPMESFADGRIWR